MRDDSKSRPPWDWSDPPVGVIVPPRPRSLHVCIAQALRETEALITRLTRGVSCADSQRPVIRELYTNSLRQQKL
jgi:hypothetical protein